jgi:vancomycin resistance protein YoaR
VAVRAAPQSFSTRSDPRASRRTPGLAGVVLTLTAAVAFAVALLAIAVLAYGMYYRDQIYPGVSAAGVSLSGVSAAEGQALLDARIGSYLDRDIVLSYEGHEYVVDPASIGVDFDTARTIENAYDVGRTGNWWADSLTWLTAFIAGEEVGLHTIVDAAALEAYLRDASRDIAVPAVEPAFTLSGNGAVEIAPASEGIGVDVAATLRNLRDEVSVLGTGQVPIATAAVPPAYEEGALEPVAERMSEILSGPFLLELDGFQWEIDTPQLHGMISVEVGDNGSSPTLLVDIERLQRAIGAIAGEARSEGRNAEVLWNGQQFYVRPATDSWVLDRDASIPLVEQAILNGEHRVTLASTTRDPALTTEMAESAAAFGNDLVNQRFMLAWEDGETDIGGSVIAAATRFVPDPENAEFVPEVDVDQLSLFLTSIAHQVEVKPKNADLRYLNGEVIVQSEEEPGLRMDREASAASIAEAVETGEYQADIVVEPAEPSVTAAMASDIQIREMLSFGETYYGGSAANRAHNVELATRLANGALVPPGGEYSFVETIGGEISTDVGYALGFGIVGATDGSVSTVPSVGGGVCQVSTTIFQAAFWAGMPMVERNWHLYWMPLYGQPPSGITGLDATVDTSAGLDFRFTNTTNDWIAIVSSANGNAVRFEIWGTDPGWNVQAGDPIITNRVSASQEVVYEQSDRMPAGTQTWVENAHDGFDVLIERQVYDPSGELIDDLQLFSKYRPASNRVLVGTGS